MKISQFAVARPITTYMICLVIIIIGAVAFSKLPIDLMPDISYPTVSVRTSYSGVGPEEIETLITRPIEEAVGAVEGVEDVVSESGEGASQVRISFAWDTNLDEAVNDVRMRLDRIRNSLPEDADPPSIFKFDLSAFPVMFMGIAGSLNPLELRYLADDKIKYRLERVVGVASVDIRGGLERQIQVNLNRSKIETLDLSVAGVLDVLRSENINLPAGEVEEGDKNVLVRTQGEFRDLDEISHIIVKKQGDRPVYLKDIAEIKDTSKEIRQLVRINGQPGILMSVNKRSGSNTVDVAAGVKKEIARINEELPQIEAIIMSDSSRYIENAISNVKNAAILGGILAILIIFVFLRSLKSTFIIATAIPLSVIASFILLYFSNLTLNIMSFGGLALGIGLLVDNAIVVLENIYRLKQEGKDAVTASIQGSDEVATAITASTITTLIVFLPLIFMSGMAGVIFKELSLVVCFSVGCSLIAALTLIPVLSSKLFRDKNAPVQKLPAPAAVSGTNRAERIYLALLDRALANKKFTVLACIILFGLSLTLIPLIGYELMPSADEGQVRVNVEMDVGTRLEVLNKAFLEIEKRIKESVPEAETIQVSLGSGGGYGIHGGHTGNININLKEKTERARSTFEIANDLRRKLSNIPGVSIRTRASGGLFIFRRLGASERVSIEIRGYDLATGHKLSLAVKDIVENVEGITDARISRDEGRPEDVIIIDRKKASGSGVSIKQIADTIETNIGGSRATLYREAGEEYDILVRLKEQDRKSLNDVLSIPVKLPSGKAVPIMNFVKAERRQGPVAIERKNQERIVTVDADFSGRDLGSINKDIKDKLSAMVIPRDFSIILGGEYEEQQKSFRELLLGIILAILLVYMVMASQFESLRDPFIVMFSIPFALIGVLLMLYFTGTTFSIQSFIGIIMLGGIAVNNAIVLVDYTNLLRRRDKMPLLEAVREGARRRLRPVFMTMLTTVFAMVPLALGLGEGGEVQAPLARVVIGGLITSTLITLIFIPIMYTIFERKNRHNG